MIDPPRQDWALYESMSRPGDVAWIRSLTIGDRLALYADLFDLIWDARQASNIDNRVEDRRWSRKIEVRQRLVNAFALRDQRHCERAAAKHAV